MRLRDLDNRDFDVVLVQTPSTKMDMFLWDRVKRKYHADTLSILDVEKAADFKGVHEIIGVTPPFTNRWVVHVDTTKVDSKSVIQAVNESTTCVFYITVDSYKKFKELKDGMDSRLQIGGYYLNYLRRDDMVYLYDAFVPKEQRTTKVLFDFIVQSYSGDIDSVFDIFTSLGRGKKIKTRKDIVDIGGIGGLSIESFIFMMLKEPSQTERGLKKVMKTRIQAGKELGDIYGFDKFYNFMGANLMTMIEIKMLIISGVIYKKVRNIPDCYNEKKMAKYQRYIWKLKEIPLSRLLRLRSSMGKRWREPEDFLRFYYDFVVGSYTREAEPVW